MSIFYFQTSLLHCRTKQPLIATIAYHAGKPLKDILTGKTYGTGQKRSISRSTILIPENAPDQLAKRQKLWAGVRTRLSNASVAGLIVSIIMPYELNIKSNWSLATRYVSHSFVRQGLAADMILERLSIGSSHHPRLRIIIPTYQIDETGITEHFIEVTETMREQYRRRWIRYANCELRRSGRSKMESPHPLLSKQLAALSIENNNETAMIK